MAQRLAALGPPESLPPPLDRLAQNLATMRGDLAAQGELLAAAEGAVAPLGQA